MLRFFDMGLVLNIHQKSPIVLEAFIIHVACRNQQKLGYGEASTLTTSTKIIRKHTRKGGRISKALQQLQSHISRNLKNITI